MKTTAALAALLAFTVPAEAADPVGFYTAEETDPASFTVTLTGGAAAMDGKTLWFASYGRSVRLADIDGCDVPQWALNPDWQNRKVVKAPSPVPCGAFSKAWLKRQVDGRVITCRVRPQPPHGNYVGLCSNGRTDLGHEMLRVGWARVSTRHPADGSYHRAQRYALAARYGMWATYVLNMDEWRAKAVDTTQTRQPIADFNLLKERKSEISPPFYDAKRKPKRTDR